MIYGMYSIRDSKTGFMAPIAENNDAVATRNFSNAVGQPNSVLGSHPGDFDLYKVGLFDSDSGIMTELSAPEFVVSATSLKEV